MPRLERPARDARAVGDPIDAPLALGAEIEMILQQHPQQLTAIGLQPQLQI
jgi:hypothetical protein